MRKALTRALLRAVFPLRGTGKRNAKKAKNTPEGRARPAKTRRRKSAEKSAEESTADAVCADGRKAAGAAAKGGRAVRKIAKSIAKGVARFLVMAAVLTPLSILLRGMWLLGLPAQEQVRSVSVFCPEAAAQAKAVSSPREIELALQVTGLLKYDLFAQAGEERPPAVTITYHLQDGSDVTLAANSTTVWWNGKALSLKDEEMFVNVTQGIFFS